MLLYLTLIQTLALFCAHLLPCKASASLVNALLSLALAAVGGYLVHPRNLSKFWFWLQTASPQRWLLPVLVQDEYSADTLANSAGLQLCRNKQVKRRSRQYKHLFIHFIFMLLHRCSTRRSLYSNLVRRPMAHKCCWISSCCRSSMCSIPPPATIRPHRWPSSWPRC